MNLDLSWSHHLRTDAPTLVKEVRSEVKRHMDLISAHMNKFDNVSRALTEGNRVLGNTLCQKCLDTVKSKRIEMHARNKTSYKKQKLMKLSPECEQIVNEISNVFMKLERSQSENPGNEEFCTQEVYYQQEMAEMQNLHTDKIMNLQEEIEEMEKKYKKEVKDKEAEVHDLRKQLDKMTFEKESCKKDNDYMSKRLKSYEKTERELRELKIDHKRLKEGLDKKECNINKLKRELELKEEDNRRYQSSSSNFFTRSFVGNRDNNLTGLKEELSSRDQELQTSRRQKENLKSERYELLQQNKNLQEDNNSLKKTTDSRNEELQSSRGENENLISERDELLKQNRNLQEEKNSLNETIDSTCEELQKSKRDNETLKSEQIKLIGGLQEEKRNLKEKLERKVDEVKSMKSQLEVLQKATRKEIVMGLWKERSGMGKTMVDMITKELMRSVGGQLRRDNIDLTIRPCTTASDISGAPLLVLCLNMSRIGTNIQDAIEGIQADRTNVFVLVLHHTNKDNLSSLSPTSLIITGSELRRLGGIIDMAFSSDSGLYECDLNSNAAEKITSIMRKYLKV